MTDLDGVNLFHLKTSCISIVLSQNKLGNKPDEVWIMNRLIKQLTDMGFPVCENTMDICSFYYVLLFN